MTQEEKASRYDEAIDKAKYYYNEGKTLEYANDIVSDIFPELKESEDEKIRKELISLVENWKIFNPNSPFDEHPVYTSDKDTVDKILAWLEKQGEQKPADKVEPKFHKGDWVIITTSEGDRVVQIASVEYFKNGNPMYITTEGRWFGNRTKARLLTDVEISTIAESKAIKSKSWSEEDDTFFKAIVRDVENIKYISENAKSDRINWLKSIKDRYTWKPSDEQMAALNDINLTGYLSYAGQGQELINLYNELKKLKG